MHKKGPVEKIRNKVHFWVDSTTRKDTIMAPRIRLRSILLTVGKLGPHIPKKKKKNSRYTKKREILSNICHQYSEV